MKIKSFPNQEKHNEKQWFELEQKKRETNTIVEEKQHNGVHGSLLWSITARQLAEYRIAISSPVIFCGHKYVFRGSFSVEIGTSVFRSHNRVDTETRSVPTKSAVIPSFLTRKSLWRHPTLFLDTPTYLQFSINSTDYIDMLAGLQTLPFPPPTQYYMHIRAYRISNESEQTVILARSMKMAYICGFYEATSCVCGDSVTDMFAAASRVLLSFLLINDTNMRCICIFFVSYCALFSFKQMWRCIVKIQI